MNGGNFESFRDAFKQQVMAYGINALGTHMVDKINQSLNIFSESSMEVALNYISNAAASCVIAVANGNNSGSQTSGETACVTAAGASVVGTYIGKNQALSEKTRDLANKLKEDYDEEFAKAIGPNPTALDIQIASQAIKNTKLGQYKNEINKLLNDGADLSKLYVALAVFAAGGSADQINISAEFVDKNINNVNAVRTLYFVNLLAVSLTMALEQHRTSDSAAPVVEGEDYVEILASNSALLNEHLSRLANARKVQYKYEDFKKLVKEHFKAQNKSEAEIEAFLEITSAEKLFNTVSNASLQFAESGSNMTCGVTDTYEHCIYNPSLNAATAFGWKKRLGDLRQLDANDHGKNAQKGTPRVQVAIAHGMTIMAPVAIPVAETSDKLQAFIQENEDVGFAIQIFSLLTSPMSTIAGELFAASPAGKATGDAIATAHEYGVNWVYEGGDKRLQSKAMISQTMSGTKQYLTSRRLNLFHK